MKTTFLLTFALLLATLPCARAAVGDKASLPSFDKGHIYGEKITTDDLRGKIVFFEYWGINCPPCRASMPHLQEMQQKFGNKGFTVIGSHCQNLSPEVQAFLKDNKVTFPVYQFLSIPEAPLPGGIPFAALIGANGKIVAMGHPTQLYNLVEAEVAKAVNGYPILGDLKLKKYKSLAKNLVSNGRNLDAKIAPVRLEAEAGNEEAAQVCKAFDAWLDEEKQIVQNQCSNNPLRAISSIERLKIAVPSVTEFDEQLATFQKSPGVQKLQDLRKKVNALQRSHDKGRRISASAVNALRQAIEPVANSEGGTLLQAGNELLGQLNNLSPEPKADGKRSR